VVLCLACVASFAQTKKRKAPAKKPAATKRATTAGNNAANKQTSMVDTTKKPTDAAITADATPAKPFDIPLDGYYKKTNIINNHVTPYANIREADAVFKKRVWEEIDVREKVNAYLASPKARLIDILMTAIAAGELTAYDPVVANPVPGSDGFDTPLKPAQARAKMADSALVNIIDKGTGEKTGSKMVAGDFQPDSVVKFRIKEDWIFDKQRSVWEPRILWIAPMVKPKVEGTNLALDYQPAFWIYFPAARQILVTHEAFNRNNDATDLSFDDVFLKRLFHGYVVKVSNDKDERIKDYAQGIDRLYESERIKKQLMDWELNLWQY